MLYNTQNHVCMGLGKENKGIPIFRKDFYTVTLISSSEKPAIIQLALKGEGDMCKHVTIHREIY